MIDLEQLRQAMHEATAKKGSFTLFGLFLREEAGEKWDLVVSAPWLEEGKLAALGEFMEILSSVVGEEQIKSLSRVITVDQNEAAVEALLRGIRLEDGSVEVLDSDFFGLKIKHAFIMRSVRPKKSRSRSG